MSWRHRIAIVLLTVLASVPVAGMLCEIACESSSAAAHGHHSPSDVLRDAALAPAGVHMVATSAHCNHDAAERPTMTAAKRADVAACVTPVAVSTGEIPFEHLHPVQSFFDYHTPPGTGPLTTTPLVLRV